MKRVWLANAALLLAVSALTAFVYLKPRGDPSASYALSQLGAERVERIRIERGGDRAIVLEKKADRWLITAPLRAPADPFQVERLLALLSARSAHRLAATDLARFELDPPQLRVSIDGETFGFGSLNVVTREQYVLAGGAVYALAPRYGAMLPATVTQLIKKQLLDAGEIPLGFELREFTVTVKDGKWEVSPAGDGLSQDEIGGWVDAWRHAAALRAEPYRGGGAVGSVKIELRDGRRLALDIVQREPELVIVRSDEKLRYHFAAETAKRLLAPPGTVSAER